MGLEKGVRNFGNLVGITLQTEWIEDWFQPIIKQI